MSLKASDLLKKDKERERLRRANYNKECEKCLDWIQNADSFTCSKYTIYTLPAFLISDANYVLHECVQFVKEKLTRSEFYVRVLKPGDRLFISWDPKLIKVPERKITKASSTQRRRDAQEESRPGPSIVFDANSSLSRLRAAATLMTDNPRYAHLDSVKKSKKRK